MSRVVISPMNVKAISKYSRIHTFEMICKMLSLSKNEDFYKYTQCYMI